MTAARAYPSIPTIDTRGIVGLDQAEVEAVARAIYCDGTRENYALGAKPDLWEKISPEQRDLCRCQARAAIRTLEASRRRE